MGTFGMNTTDVHTAGGNINKLAEEFGYNKNKINQIVEGIIESDFTSSDGVAIAEKIKSYNPLLNQIQAKLEAHGAYGINASKTTANVNEEIRANIAKNL